MSLEQLFACGFCDRAVAAGSTYAGLPQRPPLCRQCEIDLSFGCGRPVRGAWGDIRNWRRLAAITNALAAMAMRRKHGRA